MIKRVHHTSFTVSDMERSLHFYRDLLGYEFINEQGGKIPYLSVITGFEEADLRVVFLRPTPELRDLPRAHPVPLARWDEGRCPDVQSW